MHFADNPIVEPSKTAALEDSDTDITEIIASQEPAAKRGRGTTEVCFPESTPLPEPRPEAVISAVSDSVVTTAPPFGTSRRPGAGMIKKIRDIPDGKEMFFTNKSVIACRDGRMVDVLLAYNGDRYWTDPRVDEFLAAHEFGKGVVMYFKRSKDSYLMAMLQRREVWPEVFA